MTLREADRVSETVCRTGVDRSNVANPSMRAAAPNATTRHGFAVTRWWSEVNSNCRYRF
jgi:hypothetical protein